MGGGTAGIAPPLSKTVVFDLTSGLVFGEDHRRQADDFSPRPQPACDPPFVAGFVFLAYSLAATTLCRAPQRISPEASSFVKPS